MEAAKRKKGRTTPVAAKNCLAMFFFLFRVVFPVRNDKSEDCHNYNRSKYNIKAHLFALLFGGIV